MKVEDYAGGNRTKLIDYTYDPLGNLVKRVEDSTTTTTYVQDINSGLPVVLIKADGTNTCKYTYGNDRLKMTQNSTDYYFYYDGLGSTRTITNTSGVVKARYVYDVYGKKLSSECNEDAALTNQPYLFTGELYDEDTELIYLRARWYDPTTGRFLSRDTIEDRDYKYCKDDPVNAKDPSGHGMLVEMLIATTIVSILAALILPHYTEVLSALNGLPHTIIRGAWKCTPIKDSMARQAGQALTGWYEEGDDPGAFEAEQRREYAVRCIAAGAAAEDWCDQCIDIVAWTLIGFGASRLLSSGEGMIEAEAGFYARQSPEELVVLGMREKGEVGVLGRNPQYVKLAKAHGGNYFDYDIVKWKKLSRTNQEILENEFIDDLGRRGVDVVLTHPWKTFDPGCWTYYEVTRFMNKWGYVIDGGPEGVFLHKL